MTTRPTDRLDWATDADAEVSLPPKPTRVSGWPIVPNVLKPPNAWVNWLWQLVGQWLHHTSTATYTDLREACLDTDLDVDSFITLFEDEGALGAGQEELDVTAMTSDPEGGIDANGQIVVYATGNADLVGMLRDLTGANGTGNLVDFVRTNAGIVRDVRCDEEMVVAAYGNYAEAWDLEGNSLWVWDSGGVPVNGVAIGPDGVYLVHRLTTSGAADATIDRHLHKVQRSDGATIWDLKHSATAASDLERVCTNGRQVFVLGDISSYATTAGVRALRASDGADATGECNDGGNATDDEGLTWDLAFGSTTWIECGHGRVYIGFSSAAGNQILARSQGTGEASWAYPHPNGSVDCVCLAVDQDYVLGAFSDGAGPSKGKIEAFDPITGTLKWHWAEPDGLGDFSASHRIVSDGCKIFAVAEDITKVWRVTRGNVSTTLRRSAVDEFDRIRNWIFQPTQRRAS